MGRIYLKTERDFLSHRLARFLQAKLQKSAHQILTNQNPRNQAKKEILTPILKTSTTHTQSTTISRSLSFLKTSISNAISKTNHSLRVSKFTIISNIKRDLVEIASNHRREFERIATSSGYNLNSRFFSPRPGISFGEPIEKREREEGIEKERKINNSKQSYIYLKLCGQQARVSGRVCFISKGLIEKKKKKNKNKTLSGDLIHRWGT